MRDNSQLEHLLSPKSIAIIGVSENLNKIGGRPLKFLLKNNYQGKIYPVNPKYDNLHGIKCFSSILEIKDEISLAIIALPAKHVIPALKNCAKKGVKSAVIFSSGFAETGEEGKKLQNDILRIAQENKMLICGPNSVGVVNVPEGIGATMSQILEQDVTEAHIALISQSGAYGTFIAALAQNIGLGFNYFISSGNESDLKLADYIKYLIEKDEVKVIASYIEGIRDGENLKKAAILAAKKQKPIVVIKVGRSEVGKKAASSHTGSLTGSDDVYESFFNQYGILRVNNEEELLDLLLLLNNEKLPQGRRVGVISMSGGAGIQIADECEEVGLQIAKLENSTIEKLRAVVPEFGSIQNPVDITAQFLANPSLLTDSLRILIDDKNVDSIVFFLGLAWSFGDKIANDLIEIANSTNKPIAISWVAGPEKPIEKLRANGVNVFPGPSRTIRTLGKAAFYKEFLEKVESGFVNHHSECIDIKMNSDVKEAIKHQLEQGKGSLTESEAKVLFDKYQIPVTHAKVVSSEEEARSVAREIGYPLVAKIESSDILHKSDAKAVKLNIRTEDELVQAYHEILKNALSYKPDAEISGILIEEMLDKGVEVIIGVTYDPQFGPVVMFGMGGIFVEVFNDISLRVAPVSRQDAEDMIKETKGFKILKGIRGEKPSDIEAIIETITNVSKLAIDLKDTISEIDINPLIVGEQGKGAKAADALILLKNERKETINQ